MGRVYPSVVALYSGIRTCRASSWVLFINILFVFSPFFEAVLQIFASVEEALATSETFGKRLESSIFEEMGLGVA